MNGTAIYLAGEYRSATARFGSTTLLNTSGSGSGGGNEAFVARINDSGSTAAFAWATQLGSYGEEQANCLAIQGNTLYLAGSFSSASVAVGSTVLTNSNPFLQRNIFVAKLTDDAAGPKWSWAQQSQDADAENACGLAINTGSVYVGGAIDIPARFGNITLSGTRYIQPFLAGFDDASLLRSSAALLIYPNPAHSRATVQLPPLLAGSPVTLTWSMPWAAWCAPKPPPQTLTST